MQARYLCLNQSQVKHRVVSLNEVLEPLAKATNTPIDVQKNIRIIDTCSCSKFNTCLGALGYLSNPDGNLQIPKSTEVRCLAP